MPTPAQFITSVYNKLTSVTKQSAVARQVPIQLQRLRQDVSTRRASMSEAELPYYPWRIKMQQMYLNTIDNGHIKACMERRKDLTLLRDWYFGEPDKPNDEITALFTQTWFTNFLSHAMDAMFFGYSLIHLGDVVNGTFPKLSVVKRWYVSPDRFEITSFPYMFHGIKFLEDPQYKDWYVYIDTPNDIGTSPCGFGLLYEVSVYEIFLRNLLGFNGDFVEMFAQPYRHIKTNKTTEAERAELEITAQKMGSAGYAITDPTDEILFIETALGGTGYKGYDNLELRLQKLISKIILGHADAIDSTPGKLGSGNAEDNPVYIALRDKQIKDGEFVENIVNDILLPTLINLGFSIPDGCIFRFKNDAEVMENANAVTDLAVKIKSAGLQMDADYFIEQTGIKVSIPAPPAPMGGKPIPSFSKNVHNRLKEFYK